MSDSALKTALSAINGTLQYQVRTHSGVELLEQTLTDADLAGITTLQHGNAKISARLQYSPTPDGGTRILVHWRVLEGELTEASLGLRVAVSGWNTDNYVFMPAAAYNGNRYRAVKRQAHKFNPNEAPDNPVTISDHLQRLKLDDSESSLLFRTGDCSTPGMGFFSAEAKQSFFILCDQENELGQHGLFIEESDDRSTAHFDFTSPGVRLGVTKKGYRGADLKAGDVVKANVSIHVKSVDNIQGMYDHFFDIRNTWRGAMRVHQEIPFKSCWQLQEKKYNYQNWVDQYGYYSVGMRETPPQDWQTGWVGGPNAIFTLLAEGDRQSWQRSLRMFDFIFPDGQYEYGFVKSRFHKGDWGDGNDAYLRYSADTLYFCVKMLMLVKQREPDFDIPQHWHDGVKKLAQAFVDTWDKHGHFGHHIYGDSGELIAGRTVCAGLAPAAMALASVYFDEARFLEVGKLAARDYQSRFLAIGQTNAGPGDIISAPDSESCFALLTGFMGLYDITGEDEWIEYAKQCAAQAATWVMTYDFRFPESSTFGKMDMLTTGTVWANIQNKHSAPGICTLSGDALVRLYRATGDKRYMELIREIAHSMPQYLSREDRPICDVRPTNQWWPVMGPGWMNERINTSDWEVREDPDEIGVGEIFGGSCWSEAAMMLTWTELPGVYVDTDCQYVCAFDHVNAHIRYQQNGVLCLAIENPTAFDAEVKLLAENGAARGNQLPVLAMIDDVQRVAIKAGSTVEVLLNVD